MDRPSQRLLQRLPLASGRPVLSYGFAILLSIVAASIRLLVDGILPMGYPYLSFFPAVILAAFLFGRGPGIVAAVTCGFIAWYAFIPPEFSFKLSAGVAVSLAFFAFVSAIDIAIVHWMQRSNRRLLDERVRSGELAERSELLFRELQHRVSNNLQVVAALLTLQKRDVGDPAARAALDEAARRLALIGRIHRQLHDPSGAQIGMAAFLDQLGRDLIDAAGKPGIRHHLTVDDDVELAPDAAIPVALIVAEAISNAIEHGFADREHGEIRVALGRQGKDVVLTIADDGHGLPDGFDLACSNSLGLRIATTFARQLGGRFEMVPGQGAIARLTLPA